MKRTTKIGLIALAAVVVVGLAVGLTIVRYFDHDEHVAQVNRHDNDDHADHDERKTDDHDQHEGDSEDQQDDENIIRLSSTQIKEIGVTCDVVKPGKLAVQISVPGEVVVNPDRVVHVVPLAAGIVRQVSKSLGDRVEAGEILAWIESDQLAEAKLAFYAKQSEVVCCAIELPRARKIFENTNKLLALLETEPSQEQINKLDGLETGEYRGRLLTAYAQYQAAKKAYEREYQLHDRKISSGTEVEQAEAAFKKAQARFVAAKDTSRYEILVAYSEAAGQRQVAEFEAVAAEQQLRLKGADDQLINKLRALVPKMASLEPGLCEDPNCKDLNCQEDQFPSVLETLGKEKRFAWYALRSPLTGTIIQKHITLGEVLKDDSETFVIADMSTVWVDLKIFQNDLAAIRKGQHVVISAGGQIPNATGELSYVAVVVDKKTRTAIARVILPNPDGLWRPGLFVTGKITIEQTDTQMLIEKTAIQNIDGQTYVFVQTNEGFEPRPVIVGVENAHHVAIKSGLKEGERYVIKGSFDLKAKIATSTMDSHAGHGH